MSKIYVEVPTTTNQTTISIPYGEEEEYLWQFTVMFIENEYLKKRMVKQERIYVDNILDMDARLRAAGFTTNVIKRR